MIDFGINTSSVLLFFKVEFSFGHGLTYLLCILFLSMTTCAICHEELSTVKEVSLFACSGHQTIEPTVCLPCHPNHQFHESCIKEWYHRKNACPLCTKSFTLEKEQPSNNILSKIFSKFYSKQKTIALPTDVSRQGSTDSSTSEMVQERTLTNERYNALMNEMGMDDITF